MVKAHLIFNPFAGRLISQARIERAAEVFAKYGWQLTIQSTESGRHTTELARQAAEEGVEVVIVAGGDGSVEQAVAGLVGTPTSLGVLPIGTANVWAQELGLPIPNITQWTALEDSAHRLATGRVRGVDVGLCDGRPFLLWAGFGLDAYIIHNIEPRQRWQKLLGAGYYAALALAQATAWKGLPLRVEVDDQRLDGHYLLGVVSNIRLYAGGLARISPDAVLDDGLMDLWLFGGHSPVDALRHGRDLLIGAHLTSDLVQRLPVTRLCLESQTPIEFQLDGEPYKTGNKVEVKVIQKALNILVPTETPESLFENP